MGGSRDEQPRLPARERRTVAILAWGFGLVAIELHAGALFACLFVIHVFETAPMTMTVGPIATLTSGVLLCLPLGETHPRKVST